MPSRCRQILAALVLCWLSAAAAQGQSNERFERDLDRQNVLIDKWTACVKSAAAKLATSSEGAEVVAIGVLGACSPQQQDVFQNLLRAGLRVQMADDYMAKFRAKIREQVIAQVLTLRASR